MSKRPVPPRPRLRVIRGGEEAHPTWAPALELAGLGAGLTLVAVLLARVPAWFHNLGAFQALFALAFAFYALALLRLDRYATIPHAGLAVFAVALAARIALLPVTPSLSTDLYRYLWEGKVVAHGGDPYRQSPLDPRLAPLRDREVYPQVNHKELATLYPPLAIAGFALVARTRPTVGAMKSWVVLHDLALVLLLMAWSWQRGGSPVPVIAYAWNPLVLVEYAGSGHNDPLALAWLALAFVLIDARPSLSAAALAIGALVKLAPLVALPFFLPRWPWRARLLCLTLLGLGLGWYWMETRAAYSGLIAYWGTWRNNELLFHYLERWTGGFEAARTVALLAVIGAMVFALWKRWDTERATRLGIRAGILTAPVLHPWYLGWALLFEPLKPSAPWLLLSLTAVLNYGLFARPAEGRDFHLPLSLRWVEYGAPLALGVWQFATRRAADRASALERRT